MSQPAVTLLMTIRERNGLTLACIDDILARTSIPFRLVLAHGPLPAWLEQGIAERVRAGRMESRRFDRDLWPQHLRKVLLAEVDTEFVAFIDNDILVSDGWLERLLECAVATRAGAVGPVYLWGDGQAPPTIHMAGGRLQVMPAEGGRCVMLEEHRHMNEDPRRVLPTLARGPCDTVEFHCMLMRTAVACAPEVLDESIACVHEHIDVALTLRRMGLGCVLEPAAQVTYLAYAPFTLEELPYTRWRWDADAVEASIAAFSRKWQVAPDERSFGGVRGYVRGLRSRYDPLRPGASAADHATEPGRPGASREELLAIARARGYGEGERELIRRGCELASSLVEKRPALATASVLARYDFKVDVILEGLLAEAYAGTRPEAETARALAAIHPAVEVRVRDFSRRAARTLAPSPGGASPREAEIAAVESAASIAAGAAPGGSERERRAQILELIGVPGMARALRGLPG